VVGSDDETTPAGWYRQKDNPSLLRWWDGEDWTDETMPVPDGLEKGHAKAPAGAGTALADRPAPSSAPLELSGMPGRAGGSGPPKIRIGDDEDDWVAGTWAADDDVVPPVRRPRPRPAAGGGPRATEPAAGAMTRGRRTAPTPRRDETPLIAADRRPTASRSRDAEGGAHVVRRESGNGARAALLSLLAALLLAGGWFAYTNLRDAAPSRATTVPDDPPVVDKPDSGLRPLEQVALAVRDLPKGWTEQKADPAATAICYGRSPASVLTPSDGKIVSFSQSPAGPYLTNVVAQFANVEVAKEFMDLTAKTVNTCRTYKVNDTTVHLGPVDFPEFGDDTFAARASGTTKIGPIEGTLIYVRKGARVASLSTISFGGNAVSSELTLFLTRGLAARL